MGVVLGLLFFLGVGISAYAGQTTYPASTQSNSLDNTNPFARSTALGSAFTGLADDGSALFSNPGGLGGLKKGEVSLGSQWWLADTLEETLVAVFPTDRLGVWGLSVQYLDYGSMQGRDASGALTAPYGADRLSLGGGWGSNCGGGFSVGLGFQGTQTTLAGSGYTHVTSRVGLLWKGPDGLALGASYLNQGILSPGGASGDAIDLGLSYRVNMDGQNRVILLAGGSIEPDAEQYFQCGFEYALEEKFFLRAGYQKPFQDNGLSGVTGLTAGAGFQLDPLRFDYAFAPYGDLGDSHRLSLGYCFDTLSAGTNGSGGSAPKPKILSKLSVQPIGKPDQGPMAPVTVPMSGLSPRPAGVSNAPGTVSSSVVTVSAPPRPATQTKDSLVVQFDDPDEAAPTGQELEKQGKQVEALSAYRKAIEKDPKDVADWWAMGDLYMKMGQKTYATQCFEAVLQLQPNNPKLRDWLERYKNGKP